MLQLLKEHYQFDFTRYSPVASKALRLDYNVYLFRAGDAGYAVIETDYLSNLPGVVQEIQDAFSVKGLGWLVRKGIANGKFLSVEADDDDSEAGHDIYQAAVYTNSGLRYAILKVELADNQ